MKHLLSASFVAGLAFVGVSAQTTPDFSGTWTMDLSRSVAAAQGMPIGPVAVAIRQTPEEVLIETTRDGKTDAVRYFPEGMKRTTVAEPAGTFRWEGSQLVTNLETSINKQAVTVNEVRALNSEGTEMAVTITLVVQHGYTSGPTGAVGSNHSPNSSTGTNVFIRRADK